jgi:phosphoribosylformimino-5-aminoimidazole carboxamide ribotide isomerase
MRIIPVIDLQHGQVVRGIAGRRQEYRPIVSQLTGSSAPVDIARAFRDNLGLHELYLADLDAIGGAAPALAIYAAVRKHGVRLLVDAGVREGDQAAPLAEADIEGIVVGLETVHGPRVLEQLVRRHGSDRIVFSLDLRDGKPLGDTAGWSASAVWPIATEAIGLGIRRLIVLDVARVGVAGGTGTEAVCQRLAQAYPDVELIAGGGVRGREDLERLRRCGVHAVLVASALHDGRLRRADMQQL